MNCGHCNGSGVEETVECGHGCDGTDEMCSIVCPVPIQGREQCVVCCGYGKLDKQQNETKQPEQE